MNVALNGASSIHSIRKRIVKPAETDPSLRIIRSLVDRDRDEVGAV